MCLYHMSYLTSRLVRSCACYIKLNMDTEPGPAAKFGPGNHYDMLLDALVGARLILLLLAPNGEQVRVSGINRGDRLESDNGVTYPYATHKVQRFL